MTREQARAWELMADLDYCMFVTHTDRGYRARPMSSIIRDDQGTIYFLSNRQAALEGLGGGESGESEVLLAYSDGSSQFVSAVARARVSEDRTLIAQLWNPGAQAFWPAGPSDESVVAIIARPQSAEYWDGPGSTVASVKFAIALATGTVPDMGDNAKVTL